MISYDFQLTNNDLYVSPLGDFAFAPSDNQHITDIIAAFPGWWKEFPYLGVGISNYLNSSGKTQQLKKNISLQLQADGYTLSNLQVSQNTDGTFAITPNATRV